MSAPPSPSVIGEDGGGKTAIQPTRASWPLVTTSPYIHNELVLPSHVDELVTRYIERDRQCRELRDCLERFYTEATRIANSHLDNSTDTLRLRNVLRRLAHTLDCTAAPARKSVAVGAPAETTLAVRGTFAQPPLVHHGIVSGTVVKGALVQAPSDTAKKTTTRAAAAGTRDTTTATSTSATTVVSGVVVESTETDTIARLLGELRKGDVVAYERLCVRVLTLEAAERLLRECRAELAVCASMAAQMTLEKEYAMGELQLLRDAIDAVTATRDTKLCARCPASPDNTDGVTMTGWTPPDGLPRQLAEYATRAASLQAALAEAERKCEEQCYHAAQVEQQLMAVQKDRTFQLEKATQLEGQVHRLLSATTAANPFVGASVAQPRPAPPPTSATEAATVAAVPGTDELRATIARLNAEAKRRAHRCTKLENAVTSLSTENAELKDKVLQFQRQLNERELAVEREATAREDAERARELEHECAVLRNELHEYGERGAAERVALQDAVTRLKRRETVYARAVSSLLRRLFALQVRSFAFTAEHGREDTVEENVGDSTPAATALRRRSFEVVKPTLTSATRGADARLAIPPDTVSLREPDGDAGLKASRGTALSIADVAEQYRGELQQMQRVNKELRQALVRSREELLQKESLLQRLTASHGVALTVGGASGGGDGGVAMDSSRVGLEWSSDLATMSAKTADVGGGGRSGMSALLPTSTATADLVMRSPPASGPAPPVQPTTTTTTMTPQDSVSLASLLPDEDGVLPPPRHAPGVDDTGDGVSTSTTRLQGTRGMTKCGARTTRSEEELHYDPAHMPEWQLVQVENEVLLRRLAAVQEEKWDLDIRVEELERRCVALQAEVERNAATMNQLVVAGVFSPAAVTRGGAEGRLRGVQRLLQETLEQKIALEAEVARLRQVQER